MYQLGNCVCTDQSTYWAGYSGGFTTCSNLRLANDREMQDVLQFENQAVQLEERHHAMRQLQVWRWATNGRVSGCVCRCQWVCL